MIVIVAETALYESTTLVLALFSPLFVIEPIIITILEIECFTKYSNKTKECPIEDEVENKDNEKNEL